MATTPSWLAATSGQATNAGQVNQLLGSHAVKYLYTGTSLGSSTTLAGTATNTNGLYIAQSFTPGSTQTVGRWILTLAVTGNPAPLVFTIQTNSAGAPSGTVLSTTVIPKEFVAASAGQLSVPELPTSLTNATQYWFVFNAVGDVSNFYSISRTTAGSGASTSTNGSTWTAQAYGLYFNRFDNSASGNLLHTYEDNGARWTALNWNANGSISSLQEYTVAQGANQYLASSRSMSYSNGLITATT